MKNLIKISLLVFVCFSLFQKTNAQVISGKIMSLDKQGKMDNLIGASVYMPTLKKGVLTNADGVFQLDLQGNQGYLRISYAGFETDSILYRVKALSWFI